MCREIAKTCTVSPAWDSHIQAGNMLETFFLSQWSPVSVFSGRSNVSAKVFVQYDALTMKLPRE